jgi:hypothetical protein
MKAQPTIEFCITQAQLEALIEDDCLQMDKDWREMGLFDELGPWRAWATEEIERRRAK